ncbi:MAG: 2Fe-2S iron-sulfur cluster-binding protein [Thiolinea sp.]
MSTQGYFLLDGEQVPFTPGQTVMEAALAAGKYIPHLCHHPEFKPHGSCRVCVVRANGRTDSSCTLPARAGLEVENHSEAMQQQRKSILQMLFVEGNHVCPGCEKSGACQLQAVAYYVGMLSPHYTHFFPKRPLDASHPDCVIDFNRCILCELCVRASRDVDQKNVFAVAGRGIKARLTVNSPSGELGDSDFAVTDKAATVCPVGAILPKSIGYKVPIGERLYDRQAIDQVGDANQPRSAASADGDKS